MVHFFHSMKQLKKTSISGFRCCRHRFGRGVVEKTWKKCCLKQIHGFA